MLPIWVKVKSYQFRVKGYHLVLGLRDDTYHFALGLRVIFLD